MGDLSYLQIGAQRVKVANLSNSVALLFDII